MALKSGRSRRVDVSFTKVMLVIYLLAVKPSTSVIWPKECNLETILNIDADKNSQDKVLSKRLLCFKKFLKQNPELFNDLTVQFEEFIKHLTPINASLFTILILTIYQLNDAFHMYYKTLPHKLEFLKDYRQSLRIIHKKEIVPLLEDIRKVLDKWQEFQVQEISEKFTKRLQKIHNTLTNMLLKLKEEILKLKENECNANWKILISGFLMIGSVIMIPYCGPLLIVVITANIAFNISCVIVYDTVMSDSRKMVKELEKLQDKTYKYKGEISFGEASVHKILMRSYRTGRQQAAGG